jgi:two-component system, NarL family, sensor histidine kinase DesK
VVVLHHGRVIADRSPADTRGLAGGRRVRCVTQLEQAQVQRVPGVTDIASECTFHDHHHDNSRGHAARAARRGHGKHVGLMRRFVPNGLRLLPRGHRLGWTPYAWLLYLATFLVEPVIRTQHGRADAAYWAVTAAGVMVFLIAYFRAYWVRGARLLGHAGVMALLGVAFSPINQGAPVFFVYAAATAANLDRPRHGWAAVIGLALLGGMTAGLTDAAPFGFILGTLITLLVGGVNVHFAAEARAQAKLRMAHAEIEHLAAVAERERIARDLHDVLGHTLSLIVLKSELARRLATRDAQRAAAEMKDVEDVARRTLQEVREAISGYRASLADERQKAEAMLRAAGISAEFDVDEAPLPRAIDEVLALALREGVTNVVRHSGATRCRAVLERRPGEVVLLLGDDGRGHIGGEGSGLRGMRERVSSFGGSLQVAKGISNGALAGMRGLTLRISIPVAVPVTGPPVDGDAPNLREAAG